MALSAGTRLGPYEILAPLGAGGMGEVYRARDPRLKRDVALKVLPAELASEPERLERFEREAHTLAALSHPHIVTIFSVEEAEDLRFLTMELVEGKTLARVIPRGGLPLSRFFQIAIPLTEAVSAAHEKGITHRDLKPGNVMVTEEDRVKVLDFGLAKLREGVPGAADSRSPTEPATGPGRILGTAPYMSPEQVQGRALDHRSDVFSLGIILYETATGERPFGGDTFADVASSILKDTPRPVTERRADLPRDLGKLIKHCLEKEPKKRFQSTLDLANELEELRREVDTGEALTPAGAPITEKRADGKRRVWLVGGSVIAALALAVGYLLSSRAAKPPTEPMKITPFTADGGQKRSPCFSPDGEKVAYAWAGPEGDNWDIYVKALGVGTRPLRLTQHPAHDWNPVWSPDGRQIAFVRWTDQAAAIYTVPGLGGQERKLVDTSIPAFFRAGSYLDPELSWSPDGQWLAVGETDSESESARIIRVSLATLEKQSLTSPVYPPGDFSPRLSPDGRRLAFERWSEGGTSDLWVQPLDGGKARRLTFGEYVNLHGIAWATDGSSIFYSASRTGTVTILRVPLAGGEPQPVTGVGQEVSWPSLRRDRLVYVQSEGEPGDILRVPGRKALRFDQTPERLIHSSRKDSNPDYSPDGQKVAFASDRAGSTNIWVCSSDGRNPIQLTSHEPFASTPRWSPDGRRIVFDSAETGDWNLYVIDAEGGVPLQLTHERSADGRGSWSRDGRWIYFASDRSGAYQTWKMPAEGGPAVQLTRGGGNYAVESWDGRHLYYTTQERVSGIWRMPVDGGEEIEVLPGPVGSFCDWAVVRDGVYFISSHRAVPLVSRQDDTIQFLDFESGELTELYRRQGHSQLACMAVSPDEEWILYGAYPARQSELMLVENFR